MSATPEPTIHRRRLLKNTSIAAAGAALAPSLRAASGGVAKKLRVGMVGCGSRGNFIAGLMAGHGGYEIVAGADYFQDKLDGFGKKFKVPSGKLFAGRDGYKKLIADGGVDVVAIESPPYFHPEQAQAAVEGGKHVYVAKPVAVDVPGCLSIEQSAALATKKGLTFLVDFQTRADEFYQGAIKRLHDGAIGDLSWGESIYHAGLPFAGMEEFLAKDPKDPEMRLRAWGVDRVLSGDIITEQNIHTLDVASWIMGKKPLNATGSANRKVRGFGDCCDHFSVIYRFEDEVDISFTSRQYNGHGTQPDGIRNRMFGTDGVLEAKYAGMVLLRAKEIYRGQSPALYKTGVVTNIADFHAAIAKGDASNPTVAPSVESNLMTILGRTAAYAGKDVSWKQMMTANERLDPGLDLKA